MKVLVLSPYPSEIIRTLRREGDHYLVFNNKIDIDILKDNKIEYIISYGYKYLISKEIITFIKDKIINLHISYLPFNKGYYPNLWSHIEGSPSGVSIHRIDQGIDTGDIIFRKIIKVDKEVNTFESSYEILKNEIEDLFSNKWRKIREGAYTIIKTKENGSYHAKKEGDQILSKLKSGWQTNISDAIDILGIENN